MPPTTGKTIIGFVDASGAGGASVGRSDDWNLIFHLAAWHHPGSAIVMETRRCEFPVSEDDLESWVDRIEPYSIVEVEVEDGSSPSVAKLRRIVHTDTRDPELERLAGQLRESIVLHDATLGSLEYERNYGWYKGRAEWCGQPVGVTLCCANPEAPQAAQEAAARLFADQARWHRRVREYAVERLLPLKNDSWFDEDEAELPADEFLSKMSLESISVDETGDLTFWHDDGGLFWGHAIQIGGTLSEGLTDADIPG